MDRLAIIESESRRFAEALSGTDPEGRCPTCPDWKAVDLLWHLTEVHLFWSAILAGGVRRDDEIPAVEAAKPDRPVGVAELLALREQATAALIAALAARDDAEACWSWWPADQTVGFTRRMQTYEATMHRIDAELVANLTVSPIADDVAAGAIDHAVDVMWGWMPDGATYEPAHTVEFAADDTGQSWLVEVGRWSGGESAGGPRAARASAGAPTATVRGNVVDLALWSWTRGGSVRLDGDPVSLAALDAVVTQGMP